MSANKTATPMIAAKADARSSYIMLISPFQGQNALNKAHDRTLSNIIIPRLSNQLEQNPYSSWLNLDTLSSGRLAYLPNLR